METGLGRFDYASFLIECDELELQAFWLPDWNERLVNRLPVAEQKRHTRVHALGKTKSGRRRYVFTVSSEFAENIRYLPFAKWADNLTRIDIRSALYNCHPNTYEKLCVALEHAETRNNIETFKVARRTKTHQRDTGGRGVRYGSRKSDLCSKVYKRGNELPAVETQIQDQKLDTIVLSMLEVVLGEYDDEHLWAGLRSLGSAIQKRHIDNWLVQSGVNGSLDGLSDASIPMPKALKEMYQIDLWAGGGPLPEPVEDAERFDNGPGFSAI